MIRLLIADDHPVVRMGLVAMLSEHADFESSPDAYKVKLDSGTVIRSSMANTARIDIDAYAARAILLGGGDHFTGEGHVAVVIDADFRHHQRRAIAHH